MDLPLFFVQVLNGVQIGLLLFLIASGLTLVFGVMGIINLAHGSFYMLGAYLGWWISSVTGSLVLAVLLGLPIAALAGWAVEAVLVRTLYRRDHLDQVLLTWGLILVFNELQRVVWGNDVHGVAVPAFLDASLELTDSIHYPLYRLVMMAICAAVAAGLYWVIQHTRLGARLRAGAHDRDTLAALGIDVKRLFAVVFAAGAALAALAGMLAAPMTSVYPGMGENVLILCFVVVVIGGAGSVKGAFFGALLLGLADTFGRVLLPDFAGIAVYALMAAVLLVRPRGLFAR